MHSLGNTYDYKKWTIEQVTNTLLWPKWRSTSMSCCHLNNFFFIFIFFKFVKYYKGIYGDFNVMFQNLPWPRAKLPLCRACNKTGWVCLRCPLTLFYKMLVKNWKCKIKPLREIIVRVKQLFNHSTISQACPLSWACNKTRHACLCYHLTLFHEISVQHICVKINIFNML